MICFSVQVKAETCPTDKPSRSNGSCVSCDSETSYPTNKCDICPQRTVVNFDNQEWCALKTCMDYNGECYTCDDPGLITLELEDLCSKCPNRVYTDLFHYTEEGVLYRYICKIAEEKDIRLRREGNSFYYYDQNNQLVEEKHLLSDNPESDTLYKYYKNGVLWRVQYQLNYRRNGIEQRYDANGKLESEIPYKNNKMDGIVKNFFPDGKIKSEIPYQNNKKSGLGKWYHPNGVLSSTGYYKNDVFEGEYKLFNQQGEVIEVGVYKNGKIINRQKLK